MLILYFFIDSEKETVNISVNNEFLKCNEDDRSKVNYDKAESSEQIALNFFNSNDLAMTNTILAESNLPVQVSPIEFLSNHSSGLSLKVNVSSSPISTEGGMAHESKCININYANFLS